MGTGRKAYISMHAQTAHGAPGTENDVVTLPEEETKIQKLRDRLNEVYNPIISRPDEDGEDGGNEDEDGTGDEAKDETQTGDKNDRMSKDSNNHDETNHENNTDIDMETADEEDDVDEEDSEDIDTNESDMNDVVEENKDTIKLQPHINSVNHEINHHQVPSTGSSQAEISSQYPVSAPDHSHQVSASSNHESNITHHSSPMLGSHEMVATSNSSNSNNMSSQISMPNTQHSNAHLSHQPHLQHPHHPSHEMQHGNSHHLLSSGQQQQQLQQPPQHHNIHDTSSLSTHLNQQQQLIRNTTNSIPTQMQSHSNATPGNNHILGVTNVMRPAKEDSNPLSSSMLDEFEQQMNQYQQQH